MKNFKFTKNSSRRIFVDFRYLFIIYLVQSVKINNCLDHGGPLFTAAHHWWPFLDYLRNLFGLLKSNFCGFQLFADTQQVCLYLNKVKFDYTALSIKLFKFVQTNFSKKQTMKIRKNVCYLKLGGHEANTY